MARVRPVDQQQSGRHLIVTGAASGIGRAVALLAVQEGWRVSLVDRQRERLTALERELTGGGFSALALVCDVRDEERLADAFGAACERFGAPHGLVAAAGIDRGGVVHELEVATWDSVIAVNLRGTFLACRCALQAMLGAEQGGAIVCVSSPFGFVAAPGGIGAYSASKGGISALVRSLAVDYGAHGVRVNALLPGPTETELMWANVAAEDVPEVRATIHREVPLGRLTDPEEPARVALWLLSDAASYVTGAQIPCDGGVLAKASISV